MFENILVLGKNYICSSHNTKKYIFTYFRNFIFKLFTIFYNDLIAKNTFYF